jgi:hypothetical protein
MGGKRIYPVEGGLVTTTEAARRLGLSRQVEEG